MKIDRSTLLFFDASCLIAGAGSPSGGSGFLLSVCARGYLQAAVSEPVLAEAERNILENFGLGAMATYDRMVVQLPKLVVPTPSKAKQQRYRGIVNAKDEHVLAAASTAQAAFPLTLDQPLALQVNQANLSVTALSPANFIKTILTQHADYPRMRE